MLKKTALCMGLFASLMAFSAAGSMAYASSAGLSVNETEEEGDLYSDGTDLQDQRRVYRLNDRNFVDMSMDISGGIPEDAGGRLSAIAQRGVLTVATEPYYEPQEFIDPSKEGQEQYVGADMELARLIAERMGVGLEIVPMEFTKVLSQVRDGKYDLAISALAYTSGRAESMTLSKGYYFTGENASTGILIREKDKNRFKTLEDLNGLNIAAQRGSLQEMYMSENLLRYRQFYRLSSMDEVYAALEDGMVDAAAADIDTARLYLENNPDTGLMLMDDICFVQEDEYKGDRIAAPPGEEMLIAFVNGVIDEVIADDSYNRWFEEYSDYAAELGL